MGDGGWGGLAWGGGGGGWSTCYWVEEQLRGRRTPTQLTLVPHDVLFQLYLYEAVARLMAGANPTETHQLLERSSLRQRITAGHGGATAQGKLHQRVNTHFKSRTRNTSTEQLLAVSALGFSTRQWTRGFQDSARLLSRCAATWTMRSAGITRISW